MYISIQSQAIRSYAAEFGTVTPKGLDKIPALIERLRDDRSLPELARELFAVHGREYTRLGEEIEQVQAKLMAWHRDNEESRRLAEVPGIGPIGGARLAMKKSDAAGCSSGRGFSAWLGLTAKDHSTAGRQRLGGITRAGDPALRSVLVVGAMAVIRQAQLRPEKASPWLLALMRRKAKKQVAVALANKNARIAWKMMMTGERYDPHHAAARPAPARAA